jgi:hypothetical protein
MIFLAGCVTIEYKGVKYTRIGDQKLQGLKIHADANGAVSAEFESQESQAQVLNNAVSALVEISKAYAATHTATTSMPVP